MSYIVALLVFSFLIFSHELGHFLFAKKCGIGVTEFSIGMGPRLLSRQFGETRYSLKCIPFGGSCAMVGEDEDNDAENSFQKKSVWARILVVAGGPAFNLITAFLLSLAVLAGVGINPPEIYQIYEGYGAQQAGLQVGDVITAVNGHRIRLGRDIEMTLVKEPLGDTVTVEYTRNGEKGQVTYDPRQESWLLGISYYSNESEAVLCNVTPDSAAAEAGLQEGDVILSLDGDPVNTGADIQEHFLRTPSDGSPVELGYRRDGATSTVTIVPRYYEGRSLGFDASYLRDRAGALTVLKNGFYEMSYWIRYMIMSLQMIVTGQVSSEDVSGPVGIVNAISDTVNESAPEGIFFVIMNVFNLAVLLSVNLGIMNLLPLPALDGGRLLFLFLEVLRGKPVPPEKEGMVHTIGFLALMALMVVIMYHDIVRLL